MPATTVTGVPAAGSRTGLPMALAKAAPRSRNVWRPIGVNGSKTPCATFAEKYTRSSASGSGAFGGSG